MKLLSFLGYALPTLAIPLIGSPVWGFTITMEPPPTLSLDGINITTGTFHVNSATGFFIDGTNSLVSETIVNTPISFAATIGSNTSHDLFQADDKFLAIQYEGFFDPDHPDAFNRDYHLTVGAFNGGNNPDWTVFLPVNAGESAYQVTNLSEPFTTNPTQETFTDDLPMLFASQQDALNAGKTIIDELTNLNNPGGKSIWVGYNQISLTQFKPHGTGASTPEPSTILGSITVLGLGVLLKNKKKSEKD